MNKKIYTRLEFEEERTSWAKNMSDDDILQTKALDLYASAHQYNWVHQTTWLGEPSLLTANDLIAMQEIIFKTRPKYIIEIGVAWGGTLLFYASMLNLIGGGKVIGIDTFIPDDLKMRLTSHKVSEHIELINDSSIEKRTIQKVKSLLGSCKEVLIHLDSNHSHKHVLQELNIYEQFVGYGYYLICGSTIIEHIPEQTHRVRPWSRGDNSKTASMEFMTKNSRFEVDLMLKNKLLISNQADGYLKCIKS